MEGAKLWLLGILDAIISAGHPGADDNGTSRRHDCSARYSLNRVVNGQTSSSIRPLPSSSPLRTPHIYIRPPPFPQNPPVLCQTATTATSISSRAAAPLLTCRADRQGSSRAKPAPRAPRPRDAAVTNVVGRQRGAAAPGLTSGVRSSAAGGSGADGARGAGGGGGGGLWVHVPPGLPAGALQLRRLQLGHRRHGGGPGVAPHAPGGPRLLPAPHRPLLRRPPHRRLPL